MNEEPSSDPSDYWAASAPTPAAGRVAPATSSAPAQPRAGKLNILAVVGILAIFTFTPAALVLGLVALAQLPKSGERGMALAWIEIVVGALGAAFYAYILVLGVMILMGGGIVF